MYPGLSQLSKEEQKNFIFSMANKATKAATDAAAKVAKEGGDPNWLHKGLQEGVYATGMQQNIENPPSPNDTVASLVRFPNNPRDAEIQANKAYIESYPKSQQSVAIDHLKTLNREKTKAHVKRITEAQKGLSQSRQILQNSQLQLSVH